MTAPKLPKNKPIPLRLPDNLVQVADLVGRRQHTDRSTVLRQWLYKGAEDAVIALLEAGKISKGCAVEALDSTYYDLDDLLEARGIKLGPSDEQIESSRETLRELDPKPRPRS